MNNIWLALITGLTTGGISCLAVQGGLLASSVAHQTESGLAEKDRTKYKTVFYFLVSKLVAYTLLGALLGLVGSAISLSPKFFGAMQIAAGLFMLATAARLLDIHPIFRYFVIQPPSWAYKIIRKYAKDESVFAPALLGFSTVLIPCGVTQAMMVLAIASGHALTGAAIMFAFTLGTSPVFFALGATALELLKRKSFRIAASVLIIILGLMSVNTGQVLRGSNHTLQNYWLVTSSLFSESSVPPSALAKIDSSGKQSVVINVKNNGYQTTTTQLKVGIPVKLSLSTNNTRGCARAFTIPTFNISTVLPESGTEIVEFTPTKPGRLAYTCSMGMYTGSFDVIQ